MNEQMREYLDLKNKIRGWFVYNLSQRDDEDLVDMIDEIAFEYEYIAPTDPADLKKTLAQWELTTELPPSLVADLKKLGELEQDMGTQHDMAVEAAMKAAEEDEEA